MTAVVSVTSLPQWPEWRRYFRLEVYARDGGHAHPRVRIEVNPPADRQREMLQALMPCVSCGRNIHPIRFRGDSLRGGSGHLYFAATCPLDVNIRCSRTAAARREYMTVKADIETGRPEAPQQPALL